ncbi:aldo/keto reductase, partial [Staphylococcus epidermidis]|uniref:aldo/keto reductase n=1 Tax=Staphylococcus epidermidis TaxID=1282 RepID=UPI0034D97244
MPTKPSHLIKQNPQLLQNNHPQFLKHQLQNTFQPLQLHYIHFYYIHFPHHHTPKHKPLPPLKHLKHQPKIKPIPLSNFSLQQLKQPNKHPYLHLLQLQYNLLHHGNEQLMAYPAENNITFLP